MTAPGFADIERIEDASRLKPSERVDAVRDPAVLATCLLARELRLIRVALGDRNTLLADSNRMQIERDIRAVEHDTAVFEALAAKDAASVAEPGAVPPKERYGNAAAVVIGNVRALCNNARDCIEPRDPRVVHQPYNRDELDDIERDVFRALDEMRNAMEGK